MRKTKVVQAGYTKSLDFLGAAVAEYRKGNMKNASRLFAAAANDSSVTYAMKAIHATNNLGLERLKASAGTSRLVAGPARRRLRASEAEILDIEPTDEDTMAVLESLADDDVDDEFPDEEILESEFDEDLDDELDADEDDIDDVIEARARGRAFAAAVRRARR